MRRVLLANDKGWTTNGSSILVYPSSLLLFLFLFVFQISCAQAPAVHPHALNPNFDAKIKSSIGFTVPLIGVEELKTIQQKVCLFDAREKEEYEISHIKGAKYLGYDDFDATRLGDLPKDTKIVLYCSIGYRSEKIGERLQKLGYHNVYNLYGSLFDWVNRGYEVVDSKGQVTSKVHTYNWLWSKWVDHQSVEKIW